MTLTSIWARVAIALATSLLIASNASAVNLVVNPGFEDPAFMGAEAAGAGNGWTTFAEPNQFRIQGEPPIGPAGAFDGTVVLKVFGGVSGVSQDFSVGPNDIVTGLAWALNDSEDPMAGAQVAAVNLNWLADGVPTGIVSFGSTIDANTPLDVWTQIGVIGATVPDGANGVRLELLTGAFSGAGGGAPRFDGASLEIVPIPAAVWLFGSALGLLAAARRRISK